MRVLPVLVGTLAVGLVAAGTAPAASAAEHQVSHSVVTSFDGTPIYTTLFMPAAASEARPAPLILRGHGWGGHGERSLVEASDTTRTLLDAGYAVMTWDERGFGWSGGEASVLKPEFEGRDASALIDHVATEPEISGSLACEVDRDVDGTCDDPVIGMTGGSYGGGIQNLVAAFDGEFSRTTTGPEPRVDALAPEITWNDLRYSLYDNEVINIGWSELLLTAGAATAHAEGLDPRNPAGPQAGGLDPRLHTIHAEGLTTNSLSPESQKFFADSSVASYGEHHPVSVPTLLMQGSVDTLFDLTEAARNFEDVRRRAPAKLIAFCGGHVACPADYADAQDRQHLDNAILTWFDRYLRGTDIDTGAAVEYRTNEGVWRSADGFPASDTRWLHGAATGRLAVTPLPTGGVLPSPGAGTGPITAQPSAPGDPHAVTTEVATAGQNGVELLGVPSATVTVTGAGDHAHLFLKLVDRESGQVVNLQEASLRVGPLSETPQRFTVDLPGLAYTVPPGHHLDLQVSTTSLMHATARTAGTVDVAVDLRVPTRP